MDGSDVDEAVVNMVQRVQDLAISYPEGRIELQIIGGYSDPHHYSEELFFNIMCKFYPLPKLSKITFSPSFPASFHKHPMEIDLTLACVGELNTTIRGGIHWPIIYGVGVNTKSGEIFPANFPDKGPDQALRTARFLTGVPQVLDIYDCNLGMLRIGPFNYEPLRGVDLWLEQSDEFILQHLSNSPEVESPHFVMQVSIGFYNLLGKKHTYKRYRAQVVQPKLTEILICIALSKLYNYQKTAETYMGTVLCSTRDVSTQQGGK